MDAQRLLPSTIAGAVDHETVIKKSRFLAHLEPVASLEQADEVIARVRKRHWDARHHCVALIVGPDADWQRSSDDGEPSGTAGVPMLEVLRRRDVTDLVAVVTRYFGGVLLGAGGLVRAYSGAVSAALDAAEIVRRAELVEAFVDVPHAQAGRLENALREWAEANDAVFCEPAYSGRVRFGLLVPPGRLDRLTADLAALSAGELAPVFAGRRVVSRLAGRADH